MREAIANSTEVSNAVERYKERVGMVLKRYDDETQVEIENSNQADQPESNATSTPQMAVDGLTSTVGDRQLDSQAPPKSKRMPKSTPAAFG